MPIDLPSTIIGILIAVIVRCLWDEHQERKERAIREENRKEIDQELERINQNLATLHHAVTDYDAISRNAIDDLEASWRERMNNL